MYTVTTDFDADVLEAGAQLYAKAPVVFGELFIKRSASVMYVALQRVQAEPGAVKRPLRWASERQRRAFFASKGFGHGIPYKRTGKLAAAWEWQTDFSPGNFAVRLVNPSPIATYVVGEKQQPFHADTGWIKADDIGFQATVALQDVAISTWVEATDIVTLLEGS